MSEKSLVKSESQDIISAQSEVLNQMAKVKDLETSKGFNVWAKAFKTFVRAHHQKREIRFIADEAFIRGTRIMGQFIIEKRQRGELLKKGQSFGNIEGKNQHDGSFGKTKNEPLSIPKALEDFNISYEEAEAAQQFASIPEEEFEEEINNIKEEQEKSHAELTTARFLRLAKSICKENIPKKERDINDVADKMADDLQAILNTFSQVTVHWEEVNQKQRDKLAIKLKRLISIFQELQEDQKEKNSKKPKLLLLSKEEK